MRKHFSRYAVALAVTLIFILLSVTNAFYSADMLICDSTYKKLERQRRDIKLIVIDEKTEAAYGKYEAWSREKSAELAERLFADPATAPAVLAFDIMFIGEGDAAVDARLAEAFEKAGKIVCASNLVYGERLETSENGMLLYNTSVIEREEIPFDALADVTEWGFANTCISKDNITRYAQLFADKDGEKLYSLAYTAYKAYMEQKGLSAKEPKTVGGQAGFFYSGKPGSIPHFSLSDVLSGNVPASEFEDCLVFVGVYAPGFQDAYSTSVARGRQMYGVEINANIVLALMNGKLAYPVSTVLYVSITAVLLAAWVFFLDRQRMWAVIAEMAGLIGLHLLAGRLLAHLGHLIPQIYFIIAVALAVIYFIIAKYVVEKAKRRHTLGTLKKYVAPQIVDKLSKDGAFELHLGGEKKHIAVLFVDVRGFTTMSEALPPEDVVEILNKYLSVTTKAVFSNEGTLDKFIGDATMAVFNAPFDLDDYIFKAVKTAWDIREGVGALAKTMQNPIRVGIGVNCGEAVVGNIGCNVRMDYTAIGDTVNTAARLESNAKADTILISQAVYDALGDRIEAEFVGELALKGKAEKAAVYSVIGFTKQVEEAGTDEG